MLRDAVARVIMLTKCENVAHCCDDHRDASVMHDASGGRIVLCAVTSRAVTLRNVRVDHSRMLSPRSFDVKGVKTEDLSQHFQLNARISSGRILFVSQHSRQLCAYFFVPELIRVDLETRRKTMAKAAKKAPAKKAKKAPAKKPAAKKKAAR